MATKEKYLEKKQTRKLREFRYFSEEFKRNKVREIEKNLTTVTQISKEYNVTRWAIYNWVYKYSMNMKKGVRQVVESNSDTKKIMLLKEKIKELEQIVGQKQIMIEFQEKMIEIAEEEYKIEIKKNSGSKRSSGSGQTGENTPSK